MKRLKNGKTKKFFRKTYKKGPSTKTLDKKIKVIQRREELKIIDTFQNGVSIPSSGLLTLLNGVSQGDTNITREANEISPTSVQYRMLFVTNQVELTSTTIRMIIFWDQQANGAAPTIANLLDNSVIATTMFAPYNRDYQKRFKIVADKTFVMTPSNVRSVDAGATTTLIPIDRFMRKHIPLSRQVKYIGTGNTISSIGTNSLYLLQISDAVSAPLVYGGLRVYFKDT